MTTRFVYDDGGREKYFYAKNVGDCVTRAIAIATEQDYQVVYDALNELAQFERRGKRKRGISSARNGVYKRTEHQYLDTLGWQWTPTMQIGSGCKVHLRAEELPKGRIIAQVSKHLVAVIDGVIHDLSDCSRDGTRCVYGYYSKP